MNVTYGAAVLKSLEAAPPAVRKAFFKQLKFLEQNPRRPSLRAKKFDETSNLASARQ
jgi:hypothetical protein